LYQPRFSSKIAQMFSTFSGGVVAQLDSSNSSVMSGSTRAATARTGPLFQYFLENFRTLLFKLIKTLQPGV